MPLGSAVFHSTFLPAPISPGRAPSSETPDPFGPRIYKPSSVVVNRGTMPVGPEVWVMQPASDAAAVNAASFAAGAPVAPGSVVSMFGKFAGSQTAAASAYPLPRKLGETEVMIDGKAAPLYYASPGQVNLQLPAGQAAGQALAEIRVGGQVTARAPVTVIGNAPGIFAAVNPDGKVNSTAAAVRRGEVLHIFGTGLGAVTPGVEDGVPAAAKPLSLGVASPNVFLGTRQLSILFNGLAPGIAGVWQIDAMIPADAPTGPEIPLVVVQGIGSNTITVAVAQ